MNNASAAMMVHTMLLDFFNNDAEKVRMWMNTPNPLFGGLTPAFLNPLKVLRVVEAALAENERD